MSGFTSPFAWLIGSFHKSPPVSTLILEKQGINVKVQIKFYIFPHARILGSSCPKRLYSLYFGSSKEVSTEGIRE